MSRNTFEAEALAVETNGLSDEFVSAYKRFLLNSQRRRLDFLRRAFGTIKPADRELVKQQTQALSRGDLIKSLIKMPTEARAALGRALDEEETTRASAPEPPPI
jgi:hypothetical protein